MNKVPNMTSLRIFWKNLSRLPMILFSKNEKESCPNKFAFFKCKHKNKPLRGQNGQGEYGPSTNLYNLFSLSQGFKLPFDYCTGVLPLAL